jgi:type II secretory pathway component PulM
LVNELGISHILVSSIYVSIQVLLNTIWIIFYPEEQSLILILSVFIILSIIYLLVKKVVLNKIKV